VQLSGGIAIIIVHRRLTVFWRFGALPFGRVYINLMHRNFEFEVVPKRIIMCEFRMPWHVRKGASIGLPGAEIRPQIVDKSASMVCRLLHQLD